MKLKSLLLVLLILISMTLTACKNKTETTPQQQEEDVTQQQEVIDEPSASDPDPEPEPAGELVNPVMEWWELYNPNGFDTVTCVISNPNNVTIDVDYDLVFYKDGAEVSRIEYCGNYSILPGKQDVIWMNAEVPSAQDADDVRMENVFVSEASCQGIDGKYEYAGVIDGKACYDFSFDSKPNLATIWFVLYSDLNENGMLDKGEIVVTDFASLTEQTGRVSFDTGVYSYTDCLVLFSAY